MDNTIRIPDTIRPYLESIITDAEIRVLDEAMKEEIINELFLQLDDYLAAVIVDNLQKDDLEVFITMNKEKRSREEVEDFVRAKIPNAQDVFTNAFIEFKKVYVQKAHELKGK